MDVGAFLYKSHMRDENSMSFGISLKKYGYVIIPEEMIPLTEKEWSHLEYLIKEENLPYTGGVGDTGEALSLGVFRVKKPSNYEIFHKELMEMLGAGKMLSFYQSVIGDSNLFVDRMQIHAYKEKDFIARHIDKDSCEHYVYSLLIALSKNFVGGEMVLYKDGVAHTFQIPYRSILFTDSVIPHEVLPVKAGIRRTAALFLMEETKNSFQ